MKKSNPLGIRLNTILENVQSKSQSENIRHLDKILSPVNNLNDIVDSYNQAGLSYFHAGRHKEAIEQFKKALFFKPRDAKIHYNLGLTYDAMGHLDEALAEYRKSIQ